MVLGHYSIRGNEKDDLDETIECNDVLTLLYVV